MVTRASAAPGPPIVPLESRIFALPGRALAIPLKAPDAPGATPEAPAPDRAWTPASTPRVTLTNGRELPAHLAWIGSEPLAAGPRAWLPRPSRWRSVTLAQRTPGAFPPAGERGAWFL
ncbi:MAG TPA: hypothetical protein VG797_08400, partial [Phycisphaerales bacterium]|nr:hypothetical protein [Phycisphaerales bacterium]